MSKNMKSEAEVSRRDFLKGAGAAAAGAAAIGLTGASGVSAFGSEVSTKASWMPATWDYETDVLVVGHGFAGQATVITACKEGKDRVMVIDVAPEGLDGGTSSICGQVMMTSTSAEGAFTYQKWCNEPYKVDDEDLRSWAEGIVYNLEWLTDLGINMELNERLTPEWPEAPSADTIKIYCVDGRSENSVLYLALKEVEEELDFESLNNTRARRLIFDPETKEVFGVIAEQDGKEITIKATKGVMLACGGFENNREMMNTYYNSIGVSPIIPEGTPYNMGDGVLMGQEIGAALWHMNSFASVRYACQACGEDNPASLATFGTKAFIYVGPDGTRPVLEEWHSSSRHGKIYNHGVWTDIYCPTPAHAIFNQETFESAPILKSSGRGWAAVHMDVPKTNQEAMDKGLIVKADTIGELAEKIGVDEAALTSTLTNYNKYCEDQYDPEWHRGQGLERGFSTFQDLSQQAAGGATAGFELIPINPPYYAMKLVACNINNQGGPKRNSRSEVLDIFDKPIPRLYSGGEMGAIYPYKYNAGGDIAEGLYNGRVAGRNIIALEPWE